MILQKEYMNTVCQVHLTTNRLLCVGKIATIGENHIILESTNEDFPPVAFLSFVKITLKHPDAGYKVILASVSEAAEDHLRLSSLVILTDSERRGYFRIHVNMPTEFFLCESVQALLDQERGAPVLPGRGVQPQAAARSPQAAAAVPSVPAAKQIASVKATVINLSLGGMLVECNTFLRVGQRVVIKIETKKGIDYFLVSVRRRIEDEDSRLSSYQYGCMIHEKSSTKIDDLCRLILEKQALMIQKAKK